MALFLKSFSLKEKYRDIKPFDVKFRDGINVIVGENGSGKSTLLDLITNYKPYDSKKSVCKIVCDKVATRFLDTEKQNPRTKNSTEFSTNIAFDIGCRFWSHGETMLPLLLASKSFKDLILFVDEPESGISLKNQKKIIDCFKVVVKNNCQVIITTHSYVIINSVVEVFCLDNKKWMSSIDYLITATK